MRYFHELNNVKNISQCIDDRFIVTFSDYSCSIMDGAGRVFDGVYKGARLKQREDGLFEHEIDYGNIDLLNRDGKIIAKGCKDIDDNSYDGILYLVDGDGNGKYIKTDGTPFLEGLTAITSFANGIGAVRLPSGDCALVSKRDFEFKWLLFDVHSEYPAGTLKDPEIDKFNFLRIGNMDMILPFINPDFTLVVIDKKWYAINKEADIVHEVNGFLVHFDGADVITEGYRDEQNELKCRLFNLRLNKYIYNPTKDWIMTSEDGLIHTRDAHSKRLVKQDGRLVTTKRFNDCGACREGLIPIYYFDIGDDWKYTYLRVSDGSLFDNLYDYADEFYEGYGVVEYEGKRYFIDKDQQLHGKGYKHAERFSEGYAVVGNKSRRTYMDKNFIPFKEKFDEARRFKNGFGIVKNDDVLDVVTSKCVHLSEISKFAKKIDQDPRTFFELPENIISCDKSFKVLYDLAVQCAINGLFESSSSEERRQFARLHTRLVENYKAHGSKNKKEFV